MAKKPFGDLTKAPVVAKTAAGFLVRAVRAGIDPTTQSLKNRGDVFYLADPTKFSDSTKLPIREVTDKHGQRTGVKKTVGVAGWMERVTATPVTEAVAESASGEATGDRDVFAGSDS